MIIPEEKERTCSQTISSTSQKRRWTFQKADPIASLSRKDLVFPRKAKNIYTEDLDSLGRFFECEGTPEKKQAVIKV
jgi:hypothetical protein